MFPNASPYADVLRHHVGKNLLTSPCEGGHLVQFYEDEGFLTNVVTHFLRGGLELGEPLVVIATEPHRKAFTQRLASTGVDVASTCATGRLTLLDARETLSRFMVRGSPDRDRFMDVLGDVLQKSRDAGQGAQVRAYGEMVDLLGQDGLPDAAIQLEDLWNELAGRYPFSLLCAYAMSTFATGAHTRPFRDICRAHTYTLPAESYSRIEDSACRLREVSLLQQRVQALELEVEQRKQVEMQLREALRSRDALLAAALQPLAAPAPSAGGDEKHAWERLNKAVQHTERLSTLVEEVLDGASITLDRLKLDTGEEPSSS